MTILSHFNYNNMISKFGRIGFICQYHSAFSRDDSSCFAFGHVDELFMVTWILALIMTITWPFSTAMGNGVATTVAFCGVYMYSGRGGRFVFEDFTRHF